MTEPQEPAEGTVITVPSTAIAGVNGILLEPRCRVCRNDHVRTKVNDLLASGASYAMILRALEDDNVKLENGDQITVDSIRNHTARHFPVQNIARPLTGTSWSEGLRKTASTSSTVWPLRSPRWRSTRRSWSRVTNPSPTLTPRWM